MNKNVDDFSQNYEDQFEEETPVQLENELLLDDI